jgi:hypothetical protein
VEVGGVGAEREINPPIANKLSRKRLAAQALRSESDFDT